MILVYGKLVDIEERENGGNVYRTAFVIDGRDITECSVGRRVDVKELTKLMDKDVAVTCFYNIKWKGPEGARFPAGTLVMTGVAADTRPVVGQHELVEAA